MKYQKSVDDVPHEQLRRQTKLFKALRYLAPLMAVFIGVVTLQVVADYEIYLLAIFGFLFISEYFIFDHMYKKSAQSLRDRFGERI